LEITSCAREVDGAGEVGRAREFDLENSAHVDRGLLVVLRDERRVARGLRHLHSEVECEGGGEGAGCEDDPPDVIGFGWRGCHGVHGVRRRVQGIAEDGAHDDGHGGAAEDADALHREHGGNERAARFLIGVLAHNRGG
jgi:hypothetical protein